VRAATIAVLVAVLGLCGCSLPSLSSLPAPKPINGPTYELSADFDDVLNLPIGAKVKQQGVVIGEVYAITTSNFVAHVRMHIAQAVKLPEGSTAQVRFTTPLGENYIAVQAPAEPDGNYLAAGTRLPRSATSSAPTIEDAFAALSLLINGGGLDKVGTIVAELNRSIRGREPTIRYVIEQMDTLVGNLNAHKSDIDAALTGLNALSSRLAAGDDLITQALAQFPPALKVLADQTTKLNDLLTHVARLGNVAADVLDRGTSVLLADLDLLRPALDSLSAARGTLVPTMQTLTKFGNLVVASSPGNYLNAAATLTLVFSDTALLPGTVAPSTSAQDAISRLIGGPQR
jgi:phospholipid/cholesterol/gamma-HCH transport system substrate-binding protein